MPDRGETAFVALGSNLGERAGNLGEALRQLATHPSICLIKTSRFYETEPVGDPDQGSFLNAVVQLETNLSPRELLEECLTIEQRLGRNRSIERRWGPRTLDLDVLFYGERILEEPGLGIPHPRLHERAFVLIPLSDVAPDWKHPVLKQTVQALCAGLPKQAETVRAIEAGRL